MIGKVYYIAHLDSKKGWKHMQKSKKFFAAALAVSALLSGMNVQAADLPNLSKQAVLQWVDEEGDQKGHTVIHSGADNGKGYYTNDGTIQLQASTVQIGVGDSAASFNAADVNNFHRFYTNFQGIDVGALKDNADLLAKYKAAGIVPGTVDKGTDGAVYGIAIGNSSHSASNGVAMGNKADAVTNGSVAIGGLSKAGTGSNNQTTAIGWNAQAVKAGSVALGANSVANESNVVSVGKKDGERKIVNVAKGVNDTDAVNVKQLSDATKDAVQWDHVAATGEKLNSITGNGSTLYLDKDGVTGITNNTSQLVMTGSTIGMTNGKSSVTINDQGIQLNGNTNVIGTQTVAGGQWVNGNQVVTGTSTVNEQIVKNSQTVEGDSTVKGNQNVAGTQTVAGGQWVNGNQVVTGTSTVNEQIVKNKQTVEGDSTVKGNQYVTGTQTVGYQWVTGNQVVGGRFEVDGYTTLKGGLDVSGRKITGVAKGEQLTDAVNVEQLNAVASEAGKHTVVKAGDKNIVVKDTEVNGQHVYDVSLGQAITVPSITASSIAGLNGALTLGSGNSSIAITNNFIQTTVGGTSVNVSGQGVNVTGNTNVTGTLSVSGADGKFHEVATKDDVAQVSGEVGKLNDKVTGLENTVTNQGAAIEANKDAIEANKDAIAANKDNIASNSQAIVDNKAQISQNKQDIAQNTNDINGIKGDITEIKGDVAANTAAIAANKTQIDKNTADIAANSDRINQNTTDIANNASAIQNLQGQSAEANKKIEENASNIATNKQEIANNKAAIEAEAVARGEADKKLQSNIDAEAAARADADTKLDGKITTNTNSINTINKQIGADKDGNLNLENKAGSLVEGINQNTADILQNRDAIGALGRSVNKLGGEIDSVGAISAALAGLHPIDYDPTDSKYQLSAALGSYDGSSALALGGFYNFNKDVLLSLGVSTALKGERKTAGNLGVTFRIGSGAEKKAVPEADKDILTRIAELAQKVSVLEQKNDKLEQENADQKKQIEVLQAKTF